jgi:hypothetical protein
MKLMVLTKTLNSKRMAKTVKSQVIRPKNDWVTIIFLQIDVIVYLILL